MTIQYWSPPLHFLHIIFLLVPSTAHTETTFNSTVITTEVDIIRGMGLLDGQTSGCHDKINPSFLSQRTTECPMILPIVHTIVRDL